MQPAPHIAPPVVDSAEGPSWSAELDAGWLVEEPIAELDAEWVVEEPAATDGALLGKPDVELGYFPPGPSDAEIAELVDDFTAHMVAVPGRRANERRAAKRGRSRG